MFDITKMFRRWQLEVDCRRIMGTTLEVEEEGTTTYVNTAADENQPELGPSTSRQEECGGKSCAHSGIPVVLWLVRIYMSTAGASQTRMKHMSRTCDVSRAYGFFLRTVIWSSFAYSNTNMYSLTHDFLWAFSGASLTLTSKFVTQLTKIKPKKEDSMK